MPTKSRRPVRLRVKLMALAITLAVLALALEFGFRVFAQIQYSRSIAKNGHPLLQPVSGPREYVMRPSMTRDNEIPRDSGDAYVWHYSTNSQGIRGPELDAVKKPGERRVLFLGDSYTFGWAINDAETFVERLNAGYEGMDRNGPIRCLNLGVPGYNTEQELAFLREQGAQFQPDAIVLNYVMNDAEPQSAVFQRPATKYRYANSWLLAELQTRINAVAGRTIFHDDTIVATGNYLDSFDERSPKWRDSKKAMLEIVNLCRENNWPLLVTIIPDFSYSFADYPFLPIHQAVAQWCEEANTPCLDLWDCLKDLDSAENRILGDGHPNATAHNRIAECMDEDLNQLLKK